MLTACFPLSFLLNVRAICPSELDSRQAKSPSSAGGGDGLGRSVHMIWGIPEELGNGAPSPRTSQPKHPSQPGFSIAWAWVSG